MTKICVCCIKLLILTSNTVKDKQKFVKNCCAQSIRNGVNIVFTMSDIVVWLYCYFWLAFKVLTVSRFGALSLKARLLKWHKSLDVYWTFDLRCELTYYINVYFMSNVHKCIYQISMSKKCLWSDREMILVIRFLLDIMLNLGSEPMYTHYQCLKNVYGLMLKRHLWLHVY